MGRRNYRRTSKPLTYAEVMVGLIVAFLIVIGLLVFSKFTGESEDVLNLFRSMAVVFGICIPAFGIGLKS